MLLSNPLKLDKSSTPLDLSWFTARLYKGRLWVCTQPRPKLNRSSTHSQVCSYLPPLWCDWSYKTLMFHVKEKQNHIARPLPKKSSGPKPIVCHHCGVFGHLRPYCSQFQALKRIKRKEKLELLRSCASQAKLDLIESGMLLKHVVNALTFLSMCIFCSHFSNPCLTSHETLIPKNHYVWMRKGSYGWLMLFWSLI